MTEVDPNSPSLVLRATHILLVQIETSHPGQWAPAPNGGNSREVALTLKLEETLKGKTHERPGDSVQVTVVQYNTGTSRIAAVLGVWSDQPVEPGTKLIAFSRTSNDRAAEMLTDLACLEIAHAKEALLDVRLSMAAENDKLPLADILKKATPSAPFIQAIFPQYLWARYGQQALGSAPDFRLLMQFLEKPDLSYVARAVLLDAAYSDVIASPALAGANTGRMALAMLRLLGIESAKNLHGNIMQVFLPNLLGLNGGVATISAAEVFGTDTVERQRTEQTLVNLREQDSNGRLLGWLRSR